MSCNAFYCIILKLSQEKGRTNFIIFVKIIHHSIESFCSLHITLNYGTLTQHTSLKITIASEYTQHVLTMNNVIYAELVMFRLFRGSPKFPIQYSVASPALIIHVVCPRKYRMHICRFVDLLTAGLGCVGIMRGKEK